MRSVNKFVWKVSKWAALNHYLCCKCDDTWPPPQRPPEVWASWLRRRSKGGHGGMCTKFSLRLLSGQRRILKWETFCRSSCLQLISFFQPLFTSWCLWPGGRPTAGACWDTSLHQTSLATLCPAAAAWSAPRFSCLFPSFFSAPPSSLMVSHGHQHPPTGKTVLIIKTDYIRPLKRILMLQL